MHTLFFWMLCCLPDLNRNSSTTSFVSLCRYADLIIVLDPRALSRRFPWHLQGGLGFPQDPLRRKRGLLGEFCLSSLTLRPWKAHYYLCLVKSYAHGWRLRKLPVYQVVGMKNCPRWKVGDNYWFDTLVLLRLP